MVGCTTVIPTRITSEGASFDGGERNSGLYGFTTNQTGTVQAVITTHARDRYNALVEKYGNKLVPPITIDYGVTDNKTNCYMTLEALSDFVSMNRMYKRDKR